jgi:asparagine synthase (glutamine-hydrolysing)
MCGIYGIVGPKIDQEKVKRATHTLAHRGPDEVGFFFGKTVGLGHRRLSITDLSTGRQPIFNEDGSKCIIHNGEIYNFMELRELLEAKGHEFTTRSDSETILHAYEEWGEACVERLRGMFAFAVWDERSRTLFLARDRVGVNPLFYAEYGGKFFFASEMKAILAEEGFPRSLDQTALASYFTLSYIPAPYTIFSHIRKLLPGHTLTYREGKARIRKFWDLECRPDRGKSEARFIEEFMALLEEAVKIRLISDVPLGAFLSGGIDSSTVVALMSKVSRDPVNTFCMGFGGNVGGYLDERGYARQVAERYATNHREHEVTPDPEGLIRKIVTAFDEPFADDSAIPSYFVCRMARENVTVALSGLGGDEVFAGYERYLGLMLSRAYRKIPASIREHGIRKIIESLGERRDGHYTVNHMKRFVRSGSLPPDQCYFGYLSILNPVIRESLFTDAASFRGHAEGCRDLALSHFNSSQVAEKEDLLARAFYCDLKTYLPEDILAVTDRMSMLSALETRAPFIDHKFLEFCATIPSEMKIQWYTKKYLLKKAVKPLLPKDILTHRKQGFVGPMAQWLKNDLRAFTQETLTEKNLGRHGLFHYPTVQRALDEHYAGREIHDTLIWSLLIFQTWYEAYMENSIGREGL